MELQCYLYQYLKRFRFKSSDIYGYLLGRSSDIDDIPIAFAVAASAAYPVGFAPLELDVEAREFRIFTVRERRNRKIRPSSI